jgi:hypothetical protein
MDFSSQVVPAAIIIAANLLSGKHSSLRWESITAIFGWGAGISLLAFVLAIIFFPSSSIGTYFGQIAGFCLITALSRDYERILRPLFPWNR